MVKTFYVSFVAVYCVQTSDLSSMHYGSCLVSMMSSVDRAKARSVSVIQRIPVFIWPVKLRHYRKQSISFSFLIPLF